MIGIGDSATEDGARWIYLRVNLSQVEIATKIALFRPSIQVSERGEGVYDIKLFDHNFEIIISTTSLRHAFA
jgi:hypothetical protein